MLRGPEADISADALADSLLRLSPRVSECLFLSYTAHTLILSAWRGQMAHFLWSTTSLPPVLKPRALPYRAVHPCPRWTSGAVTSIIFLPSVAKGLWIACCYPTPHVGCSLGVSQWAKMLLPLAEGLIMVLETPAWLFPALVSASKWYVWDLCHNHFPSHFFPTFLFWKPSCWWRFEIPH